MRRFIIIIVTLLVGMSSCKRNINANYTMYESDSIRYLDLNPYMDNDLFNVHDILDSLDFVCLETNDKSLVSNIYEIIITNERIFIHDDFMTGGIIIFDKNGKFIKRIVNGNGPGEIPKVTSIGYDNIREELLVLNYTLMIYDKNGNYKGEKEHYFPCDKIIGCNNGKYIFSKVYGHNTKYSELENYSLIITDSVLEIKQLLLPYNKHNRLLCSSNKGALAVNDCEYISVPFTDTIYCYRNDSLFPYMTIDFSNNKLDLNQFESMEDYLQNVLITGKAQGVRFEGNYQENSTHSIIGLMNGRSSCTIFVDKRSSHIVSGRMCMYNMDQAMSISSPLGVINDWFFEILNPQSFPHNTITSNRYISKENLAKLERMKDDDNPFILFYKLKDF